VAVMVAAARLESGQFFGPQTTRVLAEDAPVNRELKKTNNF